MSVSLEALAKMSDLELVGAYYEARRQFVEKKFARDTQRARLEWMKAKMFVTGYGGVSERNNAISASEELGRKGQEVREMTRDLDLLRLDVDVIAMVVRLRGTLAAIATTAAGEPAESEEEGERP
jgi:hypothetical protein